MENYLLRPGSVEDAEDRRVNRRELVGDRYQTVRGGAQRRRDDHAVGGLKGPPRDLVWHEGQSVPGKVSRPCDGPKRRPEIVPRTRSQGDDSGAKKGSEAAREHHSIDAHRETDKEHDVENDGKGCRDEAAQGVGDVVADTPGRVEGELQRDVDQNIGQQDPLVGQGDKRRSHEKYDSIDESKDTRLDIYRGENRSHIVFIASGLGCKPKDRLGELEVHDGHEKRSDRGDEVKGSVIGGAQQRRIERQQQESKCFGAHRPKTDDSRIL